MKNNRKGIPEKYMRLPLVPSWPLMPLWIISLTFPNLVYSGVLFADTLHILKWTVTGTPVACAAVIAGYMLIRYGKERVPLKLDLFAVLWGIILIYCAIQPLWVSVSMR